jgi:septal ring factor EnvC (AmiA/AmiB activator)
MASDLQREVEELKDRADDADKLKARIEELESDVSSLEDQILYLEEGVQQAKNQASNAEGMAMSRR